MSNIRSRIREFLGMLLVVAGVTVLALTRTPVLEPANGVLVGGLLLIVAGVVVEIKMIKSL